MTDLDSLGVSSGPTRVVEHVDVVRLDLIWLELLDAGICVAARLTNIIQHVDFDAEAFGALFLLRCLRIHIE